MTRLPIMITGGAVIKRPTPQWIKGVFHPFAGHQQQLPASLQDAGNCAVGFQPPGGWLMDEKAEIGQRCG